MHGLINRAFQRFIVDTYGPADWVQIAARCDLDAAGFETLLVYPDSVTVRIVAAAADQLGKPKYVLLEDLGTYLVTHSNLEAVRRLLRFGGADFVEFLQSLPDLSERAALVVQDLSLPRIDILVQAPGQVQLRSDFAFPGHGHVLVGLLRSLADDYGALVLLDHCGGANAVETISVQLLDENFGHGRAFELAGEPHRG